MKKGLILGLVFCTLSSCIQARENIVEQFKNNSAIIYTINIRNFASQDKDNDGIITTSLGDISGTFVNGKNRLKELQQEGINTVYILPITPTGKLKALGSAGSLYAMDDFSTINSQLDDKTNDLSVYEEAKNFIEEAHNLGMNVILDLPSCGSYDLSLNKPNWFLKDENNETIIPADWRDVRLFKVHNEDGTLNQENINNFKSFVDMTINLGFDGIRADVAAIKPYDFWNKIITYAKNKKENFIFLAEAALDWDNPSEKGVKHYASIEELLDAGFDSYYGSWSNFKNIKTKKEFDSKIESNLKLLKNKKYKNKSIMASFATHDQQAPILKGKNYWNMILWLNATMPINAYFLDGFSTGDSYTFSYENKKAIESETDDELYFVHSGLFDIFNLNKKPEGNYPQFKKEYIRAINFKKANQELLKKENYKTLKTHNDKVFAYSMSDKKTQIIVIGSLDDKEKQNAQVKSNFLNKEYLFSSINAINKAQIIKNKINATLEPMELQVYIINQGVALK